MARDFEQYLRAVLTGATQGYQTGQVGFQDVRKALMLEKLKGTMQREQQQSLLKQLGGVSSDYDISIAPGGVTYKPINPLEKRKTLLDIAKGEREAFEATPQGQITKIEREKKGLSIETGGKLAMVKQAKSDIQEARDMLFPGGTPKSFSRGLALASNLPMSRFPIIGGIIPQALPFHEKGQKIYSRLQNAVAAKLRVETGAQANPSEVENILARFGVTGFSDPKAAWDALKRLENFMDETINITDPRGLYSKDPVVNKAVQNMLDRNDLSDKIQKARRLGYSDKQIQDYLRGDNAR